MSWSCQGCPVMTSHVHHSIWVHVTNMGPIGNQQFLCTLSFVGKMSMVKNCGERITGHPLNLAVAGRLRRIVASRNQGIPRWTVGCSFTNHLKHTSQHSQVAGGMQLLTNLRMLGGRSHPTPGNPSIPNLLKVSGLSKDVEGRILLREGI